MMRAGLATALLCAAFILLMYGVGAAQDGHRHPPQDANAHEEFYKHLTRPDIPDAKPGSCCSGFDCYPTAAQYREGRWFALRREDQTWIVVPEERVVVREDQLARRPNMEATLCALPHMTYCFVPPQSGI